MRTRELQQNMVSALAPKFGGREAAALVRLFFEYEKGWTPVDLAIKANDEASDFLQSRAQRTLERLLADEPIQYIYSRAHFYGMDFEVDRSTLIPRPETAQLVDLIVDRYGNRADLRVLDLGTGSGCIAIALARHLRFAEVEAIDISSEALAVAERNAKSLKAKVMFSQADILKLDGDGSGPFDIIVSNPPYIAISEAGDMEANVLMHEPPTALFVPDDDPLRFYTPIARFAARTLAQQGALFFEINPLSAKQLSKMLRSEGFGDVEILPDMQGRKRFAIASKPKP